MTMTYSKKQINRAGNTLAKNDNEIPYNDALKLLNFWRTKHEHPLQVFRVRLTSLSKTIDPNSRTGYRLKKRSSIIDKLKRYDHMKLTTMQDLAGCRIVLNNVRLVKDMSDRISKNTKNEQLRERDYIAKPKNDGYRSLHLIYIYRSELKKEYDGLFIEIQLRTKLQHVWATTVETVDLFTKQSLKTDRGDAQWSKFFKLVSSAFAMMENTPLVSDISTNKEILYSEIKKLEHKLDAINLMRGWSTSVKHMNDSDILTGSYLLLLNPNEHTIRIYSYSKTQTTKALEAYADAENDPQYNVVLVKSEKVNEIKKIYPNYFADTRKFISKIEKIIQ